MICPNPFYRSTRAPRCLGGARPYFINSLASNGLQPDWDSIPGDVWAKTRVVIRLLATANPHGRVMAMDEWKRLFDLSDKHGFVIVADECLQRDLLRRSQAAPGRAHGGAIAGPRRIPTPRIALIAFQALQRARLRSGFVGGDRKLLESFLLYRTYHGSAMSNTVQMASIAAWKDEAHVIENRRLYREKFARVL